MSALRKYHIPLPGAVLALVAFFLPWLSVGCSGVFTVEGSGYDLATGKLFAGLDSLLGGGSAPVDPGIFRVLWLIPVAAVLSLVLYVVTVRRPDSERRTSMGHIIAGLLGFLALFLVWLQTRNSASGELSAITNELVQLKYGLWLTVAGLLIIVVGGIISYLETRRGVAPMIYDPYPPITQTTPSSGYIPPVIGSGGAETVDAPPVAGATIASLASSGPAAPAHPTEVLTKVDSAAMAWLVIKEGLRAGHSFPLSETTEIGRDAGNDIVIDDSAMSGRHAKVKFEDGHYVLSDLATTNGTYLFDREKNDWVQIYREVLVDGMDLKLGRTVLHFMTLAGRENPET